MVAVDGVHTNGESNVDAPASNYILPGSHPIPIIDLPRSHVTPPDDPHKIISEWIESFNRLLSSGLEASDFSGVFLEKSFWRDLLCLTWDFRTLQGRDKIAGFGDEFKHSGRSISLSLDTSADHTKPSVAPLDLEGSANCVQSFLRIETDVGRGRGIVKLLPDDADGQKWKAFALFTCLQELKGHEEMINGRRPAGVRDGNDHGSTNWKDQRDAQQNFDGRREPAVLILGENNRSEKSIAAADQIYIGAGQGGLTLAARLKQLDVETLIIDRNRRVGDNWRNRYHQLVLHDSVWYVQSDLG